MPKPTKTPTPKPIPAPNPAPNQGGGIDLNDPAVRAELGLGDGAQSKPVKFETPSGSGQSVLMEDGSVWTVKAIYIGPGDSWKTYLMNPEGTKAIPFESGSYITPTGHALEMDSMGRVTQTRILSEDERAGLGIGGGGAGGGSATPYGYNAPDPLGAAQTQIMAWNYANDLITKGWDHEAAFAEFKTKWAELEASRAANQAQLDVNVMDINAAQNRAEAADRLQREQAEAQRRVNVAEEAGRRAGTVARDILPFTIPGATSMTLPLAGKMPLNKFSVGGLFNQGGPGNLATLPGISPNPAIPYTQATSPQLPGLGPMPGFPAPPQYPGLPPELAALIAAGAAGSGPMGWA